MRFRLADPRPYDAEERDSFREIIYSNTVQSMKTLLDGMDMMDLQVSRSNMGRADVIRSAPVLVEGDFFPRHLVQAIRELWQDDGVREAFHRRNEIQLNDSAPYFFDAIMRLGGASFTPTDQDILRARVKTTGITETEFQIGQLNYKLFDVGGQRSERRKWLGIFENVTALVFLIAISECEWVGAP